MEIETIWNSDIAAEKSTEGRLLGGCKIWRAPILVRVFRRVIVPVLFSKRERCCAERNEAHSTAPISHNKRIVFNCVYARTAIGWKP